MTSSYRFWIIVAVLAAGALSVHSERLVAQQTPASRIPVTVSLVGALPDPGAPFIVLRRRDALPRDVILITPETRPEGLDAAIRAVLAARRQGGDQAGADAMLRARPSPNRTRAPRALPWVPRVLADLRRASLREIPGVGRVRAVEIWLPPTGTHSPRGGRE